MDKKYKHSDFEDRIYSLWEKSGGFTPPLPKAMEGKSPSSKQLKPFCIIMPPPNANDPLHTGHAMFVTIEDILIRWKRMQGYAAEWLPGTDHAGIETQFVFEKKLKKEGKSRFDFDRETLYRKIWEYVEENSGIAIEQMKKLGASADWSRYKFTLDEDIVKMVMKTFEDLYKDGLVYRDLQLVNYCTHCGTAFSNLEVKHEERKTPLYYLKYGPFTLATVRPETKFGDTAIAVNPKDNRYEKYIGKEVEVEGLIGDFAMKVIADDYVDPKFGTGVVKITPAHDSNDFEVWKRHKSEIPGPKQVIGFDGKLNKLTGKYANLPVKKARNKVVEDLKEKGWIEKVDENYKHTIGTCYRCGTTIEPLPMPQFFIKVKSLTQKALQALEKKEMKVYGAGHDKILKHWLNNLEDWNISRQIVWGIRMPVWYQIGKEQDKNDDIYIKFVESSKKNIEGKLGKLLENHDLEEIKKGLQSLQAPVGAEFVVSPTSPGDNFIQETDTFDTWFSSAQWPFVTLKTNNPGDFDFWYPTDVMETAYDILPFWVMRMLMMGLYKTNKVPFKDVYFHGLIRDERGQKMSKSKGNVINPLDVVAKFGADALRMALVIRSSAGLDKNVGEADIRGMRNLTNKIWNAARFITINLENTKFKSQNSNNEQILNDKEFKQKLDKVVENVTQQLEKFKIGLAAETVYNQFWHWFCDSSIENTKKGQLSWRALKNGLLVFLKLFHPFVPFVTESVWQELKKNNLVEEEILMLAKWPNE